MEHLSEYLIHWLWLVLVVIGVSLFFTAYYFRRQSKILNKALSSLYQLNQDSNQDALDFFYQAWSILHSVGCSKMQANIDWFGECKSIIRGSENRKRLVKKTCSVSREDMRFELVLYITKEANQAESMSGLVIKTFLNILEQNLVLKQAEILTSQKRLERYQVFVQHEIKNIAQFIQLLSEQLQTVNEANDDAAKLKLVERLINTLPVMAMRARKTVEHMQQPLSEFYDGNTYTLKDLINDVIQMYSLNVILDGNASTQLPRPVLLEVFKNILGNFRDHPSSEDPVHISINHEKLEQKIAVKITSYKINDEQLLSERMFEPFWTTSESGMGLGLFLSRELLKQIGGQIRFYQNDDLEFGFIIELPGLVE